MLYRDYTAKDPPGLSSAYIDSSQMYCKEKLSVVSLLGYFFLFPIFFFPSFSHNEKERYSLLETKTNWESFAKRKVFGILASPSSIVHSLACSSNHQWGQTEGSHPHSCPTHIGGCPHSRSRSHNHLCPLCIGRRWNSRSLLHCIPDHLGQILS